MPSTQTERQLITEFLELYRDSPCLWSPQHPLYTNKEAREQALEVLLEKYSPLHDDADIDTIRKKIDNLRCCYKREQKKALKITAKGGVHKPSLWYYKLLSFLDTPNVYTETSGLTLNEIQNQNQELEENYEFEKFEDESHGASSFTAPKRLKTEIPEHIYMQDINEDIDGNGRDTQSEQETSQVAAEHEAELFGKTIGLQLQELKPMQRFIAEKLISDVIFYGRLDKLNTRASISVDWK